VSRGPRTKYRFMVERKPGYLHVSVTGDNTVENVRRSLRELVDACTQRACSRVLFEEHLKGPSLGTVPVFEIVSEGSRNARAAVSQIAYVDTNPEHDASLMSFAETVALNRGVQMRLFATVAEAAAWLAATPEPTAEPPAQARAMRATTMRDRSRQSR
jgi:hypothetical protein